MRLAEVYHYVRNKRYVNGSISERGNVTLGDQYLYYRHLLPYTLIGQLSVTNRKWVRILEVGCGADLYGLRHMRARLAEYGIGVHYHGIDISEDVVRRARKNLALCGLTKNDFAQISCADVMEWRDGTYDFVLALQLIEHVHNPYRLLKKVADWTGKNGIAVVSTPNAALRAGHTNKYHTTEYTVDSFRDVMRGEFSRAEILGVEGTWPAMQIEEKRLKQGLFGYGIEFLKGVFTAPDKVHHHLWLTDNVRAHDALDLVAVLKR